MYLPSSNESAFKLDETTKLVRSRGATAEAPPRGEMTTMVPVSFRDEMREFLHHEIQAFFSQMQASTPAPQASYQFCPREPNLQSTSATLLNPIRPSGANRWDPEWGEELEPELGIQNADDVEVIVVEEEYDFTLLPSNQEACLEDQGDETVVPKSNENKSESKVEAEKRKPNAMKRKASPEKRKSVQEQKKGEGVKPEGKKSSKGKQRRTACNDKESSGSEYVPSRGASNSSDDFLETSQTKKTQVKGDAKSKENLPAGPAAKKRRYEPASGHEERYMVR